MITKATTDDERREVLEHFLRIFDDIDQDAVPKVCYDNIYTSVPLKHSELDLIGVMPDQRGQGVGGRLLKYLQRELKARGVRGWFGLVTSDVDTSRLRTFYRAHGFKVTADGEPLPPLLGRNWVMPGSVPAAYSFYKKLWAKVRRNDIVLGTEAE